MDQDLADLVPIFVEEARDRLDRLATLVPRVDEGGDAVTEAKRELHTLKGAGRMLRVAAFAELCHAAEEYLLSGGAGKAGPLTHAVDRMIEMVAAVAGGRVPEPDGELLALLAVVGEDEEKVDGADSVDEVDAEEEAAAGPEPEEGRRSEEAVVVGGAGAQPAAEAAEPAAVAAPAVGSGDVRVEAAAVDRVADQATQMRIMALASKRVTERVYELARLAEDGIHEDKPIQVLAVLATMLRRVAVDLEGGQQRMTRAAESQLDQVLTLQVQPVRPFLLSLARHARELARSLGWDYRPIAGGDFGQPFGAFHFQPACVGHDTVKDGELCYRASQLSPLCSEELLYPGVANLRKRDPQISLSHPMRGCQGPAGPEQSGAKIRHRINREAAS